MLPTSFYNVRITLISRPDKNTIRKYNYRAVYLINIDTKILKKILTN